MSAAGGYSQLLSVPSPAICFLCLPRCPVAIYIFPSIFLVHRRSSFFRLRPRIRSISVFLLRLSCSSSSSSSTLGNIVGVVVVVVVVGSGSVGVGVALPDVQDFANSTVSFPRPFPFQLSSLSLSTESLSPLCRLSSLSACNEKDMAQPGSV